MNKRMIILIGGTGSISPHIERSLQRIHPFIATEGEIIGDGNADPIKDIREYMELFKEKKIR